MNNYDVLNRRLYTYIVCVCVCVCVYIYIYIYIYIRGWRTTGLFMWSAGGPALHMNRPVVRQPATRIAPQPSHNETPTHIVTRTHDQCGDTIEKPQAPDDGCINVRNMLSIEEVKWNLLTSDIKLVSYSSTITMMHGPICIRYNICYLETHW